MKLVLILILISHLSFAQNINPPKPEPERWTKQEFVSHVLKPKELAPASLESLKVPEGFKIEKFAENVGNARVLAIGPDGSVYVTRREQADVLRYEVADNGLSSGKPTRVAGRAKLHGITFHKNKVFLVTVNEVFTADVKKDGSFGPLKMIIHDLPDGGQHHTRTIQVGPDDMLYISAGSTCNECKEPNAESATLLRASLDGAHRTIFASGLRDTIGWGWHPVTGEIWGMDHGMDWMGDDFTPEELNHIEKGKNYGWPFIFADNKINPRLDPSDGTTKEDWKKISTPMVLGYTAHSAPMQLSFYNSNQFPKEFRGDAFISMHGSWNRKPASGYEVLRIRFKDGEPQKFEPFVTGFLTSEGQSGRPMGNVIARDGSLLFTDDYNGIIYRVSYTGSEKKNDVTTAPPAGPMKTQNKVGEKTPLAKDLLKAKGSLTVSSSFENDAKIPEMHSSYDQNASPELSWSKGAEGTKTYAILMEDPDAKSTPLPIIHWIAWNIPAEILSLPQGFETGEKMADPKDMRQGVNSMGHIGYEGPHPPKGDPMHTYHFQVFAVDSELDLPMGTNREQLLDALKGHVISGGGLRGKYQRPEKPEKP